MTLPLTADAHSNDASRSRLLRGALLGNATFSTVSGIAFVVLASWLAGHFGTTPTWVFLAIGVGLLAFAVQVTLVARARPVPQKLVLAIIAGDLAWVVGSALLVALRPIEMTTVGLLLVVDVALLVLVFAVLQSVGLARLRR